MIEIPLPPLRERKDDIALLVDHFIEKYARELGKDVKSMSDEALAKLVAYRFPGNVRELENVVYEAMVMSEEEWLDEKALPSRLQAPAAAGEPPLGAALPPRGARPLREAVQGVAGRAEREIILEALRQTGGNRTRAAGLLGVSRKTLFNKMTLLAIRWPE